MSTWFGNRLGNGVRRWRMLAVLGFALGAGVIAAPAVPAQDIAGERITSLTVDIVVRDDGRLAITERIRYDFDNNNRHGIFRDIPNRYRCEALGVSQQCPEGFDRIVVLRDVQVRTQAGTPGRFELIDDGYVRIKIGDPNITIRGVHDYEITYVADSYFSTVDSERGTVDRLKWNLVGNAWLVPIDRFRGSVRLPATPVNVDCASGPQGSTADCDGIDAVGSIIDLEASDLKPGDGVTVDVDLAPGAITAAPIVVDRRFSLGYALTPTGIPGVAAAGTVLAGVALVAAAARKGRDRRFAGSAVDVAFGSDAGAEQHVGVFENLPQVMEFEPPDGIRPGQMGALLDENVQPRDVTATIVDLAMRGYLRIEPVDPTAGGKSKDWRIVQLAPPTGLRAYEMKLLTSLFASGPVVELSDLKQRFHKQYAEVSNLLYDDLVQSGWYPRRPDRTRTAGMFKGLAIVVLGAAVTFLLVKTTQFGLVGVAIVIVGIATAVAGKGAPARTAKGTALTARSLGFRRLVTSPTPTEMSRFAERTNSFAEFLPYAIVFQSVDKWAKRFADLGIPPPAVGGFVVGSTMAAGRGNWDDFSRAVSGLERSAGSSFSSPSSSSSSGGSSSGGGGGGGGGGSW